MQYSMWIPKGISLWVYSLPGYLPQLEVKNSDGDVLPVLSHDELNFLIQNQSMQAVGIEQEVVTQDVLHELTSAQSSVNRSPVNTLLDKSVHYVGILLPEKLRYDYFEEITIKWISPIKIQQKTNDGFSLHIAGEHTIGPSTTASTYFDLQMDGEKYQFIGYPTISATEQGKEKKITDGEEYKEIFKDKEHYVYRTRRNSPLLFKTKWSVGIPKLVRGWAWGGFVAALAIMSFSVIAFIIDQSYTTFYLNARLLAGLAALIVGFRVLLFHDIDLMIRWNYLYLLLLVVSIGMILIMGGLQTGNEIE